MKLSIITINLNNDAGLRKTIESVVNQTSCDFEYIIIDGSSNDSSVEIIKSHTDILPGIYTKKRDNIIKEELFGVSGSQDYQQETTLNKKTGERHNLHKKSSYLSPITYWISETDMGIYHAMNKGIMIAQGEYCQFLNSGDWLVNSKVIEEVLIKLPNTSIVYGNMIKQMSKYKILKNKKIQLNSFLTFYTGTLNHSPAFIKRTLFDEYGLYDENLRIVSDWKFFMITIGLNNESVSYLDIDITCHDMNGISNCNPKLDKFERQRVLEDLLPTNILTDYDLYGNSILKMKRINRFILSRWTIWLIERFLFKLEKLETRLKREHILY